MLRTAKIKISDALFFEIIGLSYFKGHISDIKVDP